MSEVFLLGHPVGHSLSPAMHNAAFKALGLPHRYSTREVKAEKLAEVVGSLRGETALGANLTIPHKETALRLVDETSEEARRIGAVNTIVRRGSRLLGENTDKYGFDHGFEERPIANGRPGMPFEDRTVLVLGAGGAARAVVLSLLGHRNSVVIANRDAGRAEALVREMTPHCLAPRTISAVRWPTPGERIAFDGVVNATPLGLRGEDPLAGCELPAVVVDIVPTAHVTPLVARARQTQGVELVVDGLPMLLHQAARSFELWTGAPAPLEVMRAALPRPA